MTKLYIIVGNVGSGKSTWIKKFLAEQKDEHTSEWKDEQWVVVSKDAIRWMLGGGDKYLFDPDCLEYNIEQLSNDMIYNLLTCDVNVIVDETNGDVASRQNILELVFSGVETTAVCMPFVDRLESLKRKSNPDANYGYDRETWDEVWRNKNGAFVAPSLDEGFDKILYVD